MAQVVKRKSKTSSEVKNRYNRKTYTYIQVGLHKDVATAYKAKCKELGIEYSRALHDAVSAVLEGRYNKETGRY